MTESGVPGADLEPFGSGSELATPEGAVGDSLSVAIWTVISRFTGALRGITIAAVLGATYFANTYQYTNSLPNLISYGPAGRIIVFFAFCSGPRTPHRLRGQAGGCPYRGRAARVALRGMLAIVPVIAVLTPWLLPLSSIGASDAAAAHSQAHTGAVLVLLLLPQVPFTRSWAPRRR